MGKKGRIRKRRPRSESMGAEIEIPLAQGAVGPFELRSIAQHVASRIRVTGKTGRPSVEDWTVRRLVPFRRETWDQLGRLADRIFKEEGVSVSPAQLAAILVERGIDLGGAGRGSGKGELGQRGFVAGQALLKRGAVRLEIG